MIITLKITTNKEIESLVDKIMGRIYTMDGVEDVELMHTIQMVGIKDEDQESQDGNS